MKLETIKAGRIRDMADRMSSIMYDNWFGGDTILVKNQIQKTAHGIPVTNYYFTIQELELIERENVLDTIRKKGWDVTVSYPSGESNPLEVTWTFKSSKE